MRLFVLIHPDFVGDNNQLRGIAKACTGFTTTIERQEHQITREDLSFPHTTVLTAGDHGILMAEQIRKEHPHVKVIWSGHLFFDTFATLNASYWPHVIALPKSVITEAVRSSCPAHCRIIPTDGVAHNVNDHTVAKALNAFLQETLPPSTITSCVGIVLAGDAPRPDKTMLYFSEDDAREQANKIVSYIHSYFGEDTPNVAVMITNGPRTGQHDAQTGVLRTPDPHRSACIDPVSQAFLAVLKAHFPDQLFFYDFQFGQPSAYLPMMARTARAERALWFVPAESSSMVTESSYLSTKGVPAIVYTPQSANEIHFALVEENRSNGMVSLLESPLHLALQDRPEIQLASEQIARELSFPDNLFTDDLRKSTATPNPTISPEIDCVWVLSGRSTVLGHDADGLKREFDDGDDLARILEGIRVATQVNLLKAGKEKADQLTESEWVTPIFYNGRKIHNQDLKKALAEGKIPYPPHLFIIEDITPENTIGQIRSFKDYFSSDSERIRNVAIVSSAYHLPRVARTIGKDSPQTGVEKTYSWQSYSMKQKQRSVTVQDDHPIRQFNFFLFGVHKQDPRRGIMDDLQGECRAMCNYSSGKEPSIARQQSNNTFLNNADLYSIKAFNRALFWHHVVPAPHATKRPEHIEHAAASVVHNALRIK